MKTKTDTISASSLETGTLDDKVAQRIKVYEFDNGVGFENTDEDVIYWTEIPKYNGELDDQED